MIRIGYYWVRVGEWKGKVGFEKREESGVEKEEKEQKIEEN